MGSVDIIMSLIACKFLMKLVMFWQEDVSLNRKETKREREKEGNLSSFCDVIIISKWVKDSVAINYDT